ncbi:DNA repair and recombination protein RadA [Candidatus Bathyarchaeota archaeon]|nr:DNA repair and recombination protein RadA [Candidatus Bathyarchaeota archaeon]
MAREIRLAKTGLDLPRNTSGNRKISWFNSTINDLSRVSSTGASPLFTRNMEHHSVYFITASELMKSRSNSLKLPTGSKALDAILHGGYREGSLTEISGPSGSGKTQLVHQACVNLLQFNLSTNAKFRALFIDTEGTFRPERLLQMAIANGMNVKNVLRDIIYARVYNFSHQIVVIEKARDIIKEQGVKLLVVDSIINHLRAEYGITGTQLVRRQQLLNVHLHQLLQLAGNFGMITIITNQVMVDLSGVAINKVKPVGGNIMAHGCAYRLMVGKNRGRSRVAELIHAPDLPQDRAIYYISEQGIRDSC